MGSTLRSSEEGLDVTSDTVPGAMNGESNTAPIRPPPGPFHPGLFVFGPGCSLQHAVASSPIDSSKVMTSRPLARNAGELVMMGTQCRRNRSAETRPPGSWLTQG